MVCCFLLIYFRIFIRLSRALTFIFLFIFSVIFSLFICFLIQLSASPTCTIQPTRMLFSSSFHCSTRIPSASLRHFWPECLDRCGSPKTAARCCFIGWLVIKSNTKTFYFFYLMVFILFLLSLVLSSHSHSLLIFFMVSTWHKYFFPYRSLRFASLNYGIGYARNFERVSNISYFCLHREENMCVAGCCWWFNSQLHSIQFRSVIIAEFYAFYGRDCRTHKHHSNNGFLLVRTLNTLRSMNVIIETVFLYNLQLCYRKAHSNPLRCVEMRQNIGNEHKPFAGMQ